MAFNIGILFTGDDGGGVPTAGSYRYGQVPLRVLMTADAATLAGVYPITCATTWGDGASNTTTITSGQSSVCQQMHTFTVAGVYNTNVTITDALGVGRSGVYKFEVWSGSQPASFYRVWIEGQGAVANLSRQTYTGQPIMAFILNNGTQIINGFTATWYMNANTNNWGNVILTKAYTTVIAPGSYFPITWPGNTPQIITTVGTQYVWVKVQGARNVTSVHMPVVYQGGAVPNALALSEPSTTIFAPNLNSVVTSTFTVTNPTPFTLFWYDTIQWPTYQGVTYNWGSISPGAFGSQWPNGADYYMNGTAQAYLFQNAPFGLPPNSVSITNVNLPASPAGVYLEPGQSITFREEVLPNLLGTVPVGLNFYSRVFSPVLAGSCTTITGSCSMGGAASSYTNFVQTGTSPTAVNIRTSFAAQIGNGSVKMVGYVLSMGQYASFTMWFTWTLPNGTTYISPTQLITNTQEVDFYAFGLPQGNYTQFALIGQAPDGTTFNGGYLTFTIGVAGSTSTGNINGNGQAFTQGFLFAMAGALGMPAVFLGLVLGIIVSVGMVIFLAFIQSAMDVEIPGFVWAAQGILAVVINALFFLWPSWVILILIVFEGFMIWSFFTGGGGLASGGDSGG